MICFAYPVGLSLGSGSLLSWPVFVVALLGLCGGSAAQRFTSVFVWVRAAPAPREEMMAAMALGALVLGVPHFEESTTPSLAPKTGEAPAQQPQPPQPPQQQADEGHHPLKKMQKRVLAHEQKMKLEKAQGRMRKLEEAREKNAGKQGHDKKELKKKFMAKKRLKNARARHHEAARVSRWTSRHHRYRGEPLHRCLSRSQAAGDLVGHHPE